MKHLFLAVFSFFLFASCNNKELPTKIELTDTSILVLLSYQSTQSEVEQLKTDLQSRYGLTVDDSGTRYFDDGKLRDLKLSVQNSSGKGGSVQAMLFALEKNYWGFQMKVVDGKIVPMRFGNFGSQIDG